MKAQNEKEINSLWWQAILGFSITVIILVYALNYDFSLPIQLNEAERNDLEKSRSIVRNEKKILAQVHIVDSIMDKIETSSSPTSVIIDANTQNETFKTLLKNDTMQTAFLSEMYKIFSKAIAAKQKNLDLKKQMDFQIQQSGLEKLKIQTDATKEMIDRQTRQ